MPTPDVAPGSARREGRGFISSFGAGRTCAVADCTTALSRYNDKAMCALHEAKERGAGR